MAPSLSLIEQLREFETPLITEAMAAMGCQIPEKYYLGREIRLLTSLAEPMVGIALTLTADTSTPGNTPDIKDFWECCQMITRSALPTVVVVKAIGSRPRHECILGDGMSKILRTSGSCGLLTDGGARDIERINRVNYPVFGTGVLSNHAQVIIRLTQKPVQISGIDIAPGDLIHGDADGIVVIPSAYHAGLVEACILGRDVETRVHVFWRRTDKTIAEKQGYYTQMYQEYRQRCQTLIQINEKDN